jgi:hypothetical protein
MRMKAMDIVVTRQGDRKLPGLCALLRVIPGTTMGCEFDSRHTRRIFEDAKTRLTGDARIDALVRNRLKGPATDALLLGILDSTFHPCLMRAESRKSAFISLSLCDEARAAITVADMLRDQSQTGCVRRMEFNLRRVVKTKDTGGRASCDEERRAVEAEFPTSRAGVNPAPPIYLNEEEEVALPQLPSCFVHKAGLTRNGDYSTGSSMRTGVAVVITSALCLLLCIGPRLCGS